MKDSKELKEHLSWVYERFYIVYIDESGVPDIYKKGRYYILFGLAIPIKFISNINDLGTDILNRLRNEGYNKKEIKGNKIYSFLKKKDKTKYIRIIKNIVNKLNNNGLFAIAVVLDKKGFKEKTINIFKTKINESLKNIYINNLNVLYNNKIREEIIKIIIKNNNSFIVRAQCINELFVVLERELDQRRAWSVVIFDSDAAHLAGSSYKIFAEAIRHGGIAHASSELMRANRILSITLTKSELDYGIQLADLLVNALYNCINYKIEEISEYILSLFPNKGLVVLPEGEDICRRNV